MLGLVLFSDHFNPHSHEGSDKGKGLQFPLSVISIHTPTRGVTIIMFDYYGSRWFQSTLPRGEWRVLDWYFKCHSTISIHTPTRGVTGEILSGIEGRKLISIHTPTRGVTYTQQIFVAGSLFQSTLPRGEWLHRRALSQIWKIFQSTLPRGEWRVRKYWSITTLRFQSTLPRGEWLRL